jgi:hypothetical protein
MQYRSLAVVLLLASVRLHSQSQAFLSQLDLFHQGEAGVNTYRIPALLQSAKGTLIAVADARRDTICPRTFLSSCGAASTTVKAGSPCKPSSPSVKAA